jgi:uncharacterized protein (TIGR03435 family)
VRTWVSIAGAVAVCSSLVTAQQRATFEVASVKPNRSGELMIRLDTEPGGRFLAINAPLRSLIQLAYAVQDFEIIGAPGWAASEPFDITAKATQELPPLEGPNRGSPLVQQMLQALLRERFSLVAHTETRELQGLALMISRSDGRLGPRLTPSKIDCAALIAKAKPDDGPPACGFRMSPGSIVLEGVPVSQIASGLSGLLGRRIVDRTGLNGNFDLQLHWDPPARARDGSIVPTDTGVSLFTALGDQAGLKLTEAKLPGTVLVIDSVQRPTPN